MIYLSECLGVLQQEHIADIATLKTKVEVCERKIDKFDLVAEAVIEIKTIVKQFKQDADKRAAQDAKITETLSEICINITSLNTKVDGSLNSMAELEDKVDEQISELQNQLANSEDKNLIKIDVRDEAKKSWLKRHSLPIGIGGSILGTLALIYSIFF